MTDSMNIDADIVESLEEFESLDRIQMDYFRKPGHDHGKVIIPDIMPEILSKDEIEIKSEQIIVKMEDEDMREEIHENISSDMMEEPMSDEVSDMMHNVMEVEMNEEGVIQDHDNHGLFGEGVIGEEIIEDEHVIQDNEEPRMYEEMEQHITEEEVLEDVNKDTYPNSMDDIVNETVVGEETVIESTPAQVLEEIHDEEEEEEEEEILDQKPLTIETHVIQQSPNDSQPQQLQRTFIPQVTTIRKNDNQGKVGTSSVYVMNTTTGAITAQSLLQSNTILAPKDTKMTRVVLPSNVDSAQAIRIVAPQGKVLGSTAKTITIAQAKQMGILPQAKINQILPATAKGGKLVVPSKKTVTVVKSPTKILPAPLVTTTVVPTPSATVAATGQHKTQKVLIRSNSLKPGAILTTASAPGTSTPTAGQVIRIPTSQALAATTLQIPTAKPVQYVKLVGSGNKSQTLVPVTLSKTVPLALTTSLLNNSQTAFKVIPISTAQGSQQATTTQRVFIPTSAVSQQQSTGVAQQSQSIAVMVPSHLIHQVKKEKVVPAVNTLRTTNGKRASTPSIKKDSVSPPATTASSVTSNNTTATTTGNAQSGAVTNIIKHDFIMKTNDAWSGDEAVLEANGIRPRKPCNCTKSMCLKLYCDCFANGEFCNQCNCTCCSNNLEHEEERQRAIKSCLERNPTAFRPKIGKTFTGSEERRHNKGCNCRRSGCLKNYCECYEAKIPCSKNCKCVGCKNTEGASGKRGGSGAFEIGDDRLKAETNALKQIEYSVNTHRQAFSQITDELVEATCQCLVAKADKWDRQSRHSGSSSNDEDIAQSLIIEEFGRCLVQIIEVVSKSIAKHHPPVPSAT